MLGEKDLIFLGACILAASESGEAFVNNYFLKEAIEASEFMYKEIFNSNNDENMILE